VQHRVTAAAASVGVDGTTLLDTGVATPSWNATLTDASVFVRAPPPRAAPRATESSSACAQRAAAAQRARRPLTHARARLCRVALPGHPQVEAQNAFVFSADAGNNIQVPSTFFGGAFGATITFWWRHDTGASTDGRGWSRCVSEPNVV
jgi:hypothetical protein